MWWAPSSCWYFSLKTLFMNHLCSKIISHKKKLGVLVTFNHFRNVNLAISFIKHIVEMKISCEGFRQKTMQSDVLSPFNREKDRYFQKVKGILWAPNIQTFLYRRIRFTHDCKCMIVPFYKYIVCINDWIS